LQGQWLDASIQLTGALGGGYETLMICAFYT